MDQDWLWGLAGGGLIGLAASMFLLVNGRIMGATGILGEVVDGSAGPARAEKLAFIAGLILAPAIVVNLTGGAATGATHNVALLVIAGVLVGFGTRLANGCTSGHGVCGISRLAPRGIVATLFYIGAGAVTVALFRHIWGIV